MVRIVAPMGGKIKGHAEALLTSLEILSVKGVAFLYCAESSILDTQSP